MPTIDELQAELDVLQRRTGVISALVQAMRDYEALTTTEPSREVEEPTSEPLSASTPLIPTPNRPSPIMQRTEAAASDLMMLSGKPVTTSMIVAELRRQGEPLPESNALNVVSARMSNSNRFKGKRGTGWWFVNEPWPDEIAITSVRANGNGALNGQAVSAPEAERAATPSNEDPTVNDLLG